MSFHITPQCFVKKTFGAPACFGVNKYVHEGVPHCQTGNIEGGGEKEDGGRNVELGVELQALALVVSGHHVPVNRFLFEHHFKCHRFLLFMLCYYYYYSVVICVKIC